MAGFQEGFGEGPKRSIRSGNPRLDRYSTFTGYINRLRGYYDYNRTTSYYFWPPKKYQMHGPSSPDKFTSACNMHALRLLSFFLVRSLSCKTGG